MEDTKPRSEATIFGLRMDATFKPPFAALMMPIQAVVNMHQKKA